MSKFLRYGNMLSVDSIGEGPDPRRITGTTIVGTHDTGESVRAFQVLLYQTGGLFSTPEKSVVREGDFLNPNGIYFNPQWTILDQNGLIPESSGPNGLTRVKTRVKFGDSVVLRYVNSRLLTLFGDWYLSARNDWNLGDGHKSAGMMPFTGPWERWQIINPQAPASTAEIKFGDTVAIKSKEFGTYLSRGKAQSHPRPASIFQTLGETEKWVLGTPELELSAANLSGSDSTSLIKVPERSDPMALLSTGLTIQDVVSKAASKVPKVGSVLGPLIEFLWPKQGPDVWALIKDRVQALVNDAIFAEKVKTFESHLRGIRTTLKKFYDTEGKLEKGIQLLIAVGKLDDLKEEAVNLDRPETTLTHLVTLGTLHIAALRELCVHGPELFAEDPSKYPQRDRNLKQEDFKKALDDYSKAVKTARGKVLEWRLNKLQFEEKLELKPPQSRGRRNYKWTLYDAYTDRQLGLWWSSKPEGTGNNKPEQLAFLQLTKRERKETYDRLTGDVRTAFGYTLDHLLMPAFLWPYMNPEGNELPLKTTASVITGPYGGTGGGEFSDDPQGQPITAFDLAYGNHDRVNIITGVRFKYGDKWGAWHGGAGSGKSETLNSNEKIVQANGMAGRFLDALYFTTNENRTLGGGWTGGGPWEVKLPRSAEPTLVKISGRQGEVLDSIMLHWQYSRWE